MCCKAMRRSGCAHLGQRHRAKHAGVVAQTGWNDIRVDLFQDLRRRNIAQVEIGIHCGQAKLRLETRQRNDGRLRRLQVSLWDY